MKGFFIEVSNNLLDPKHCKQMGDAVWLFMWLIDKITTVNKENGRVLGGKPIKYNDIEKDLGISRSTYNRWMKILKTGGYVKTVRTPYGSCIVVLKAKKRFGKETGDVSEMTHVIRCIKDKTSLEINPAPDLTHQSSDNDTSMFDYDTSNIRSKTASVDKAGDIKHTGPSGAACVDKRIPGGFTDQLESTLIFKKIEEVPYEMVNETLALFLPVFPMQFIKTGQPFGNVSTREAVGRVLMRYSIPEIKSIIDGFLRKRDDKYCPQPKNIYTFCTFSIDNIKAYILKPIGGLWAQRPISTPEQRAASDALIKQKTDAIREKQRINKEEWEKEHPQNNGQ
jgi:hypothetical protein